VVHKRKRNQSEVYQSILVDIL